jgi:hypothetical protein
MRDVRFPSRFRAPTNVPRYDGDTNPSVWLEDYRLVYHTGGTTDDLFIIKNLPLYLGDSASMWLKHLPRGKINDWTDLRQVFVSNFQACTPAPARSGSCATATRSRGRACMSTSGTSPSATTSFPARWTMTPSQHFRTALLAPSSSINSGAAHSELLRSSSTSRATTQAERRRWG